MSLVLDTGTMKYRENPNQPWRPLVIKAGMNWESMADTYDPDNGTYEVGQYVLEEGMMYRCISEIVTPEAWTPAHWTSVNVGDELSSFIIISDEQPTDETNKIWIAETTAPFGVQIPTMDDHNALENTLNQLDATIGYLKSDIGIVEDTNTAQHNISKTQYVIWKGQLYTATAAISIGETLSNNNLSPVTGGALNTLVFKKYFQATSSGNANVSISDFIDTYYYTVIGASVRDRNNTSTLYAAIPYMYSSNTAGSILGLHLISETLSGSAANKNIEGYLYVIPSGSISIMS